MKNTFVADWGEVCLWFLFSKHVHRSKLMQQVVIFDDLKKKRERNQQQQNSCFPIGQSALCKNGRYILTDQLYLSVCPMIVATMWTVYSGFCIVALPEHHLLYVCDVFLPFCCVCFFGWYWWAVHFPGLLAPEGSKLQISVVSGQFHLKSVGVDEA